MDKRITIYDIAREAGVSTATVTRVTSGSSRVSAATRERVQRVIDAHGYVPSAAAHDLESRKTRMIGVIMPSIENPYFARIYNTIYTEAAANGYHTWLIRIDGQHPIPSGLVEELIGRRLDGVIFAGGIWSAERAGLPDALRRLRRYMPVVMICPPTLDADCICIRSDLLRCSRLPVRHLHALGHRRIAFIGGSTHYHDASSRGENFLEELRSLCLPDNPAYHVDCGYDMESGERAVLRILSGLPRGQWPTGIIAFNDQMALGAMKQLKRMGLTLPEDMAIVGCDNQFFCAYTDPPLTTVDLHPEELGVSAVRALFSDPSDASFSLMREATLIVRESCGAQLGYRKLG